MSFASRLKQARINKNMTQQQLAEKINVGNTAISNYEKGISFPNTDILYLLFDVLDVDPNYLFWDDLTDEIKNKILEENNLSRYKRLTIEDKQKVDTYISDLLATQKYQVASVPREIAAWGADGTKGTHSTSSREIT